MSNAESSRSKKMKGPQYQEDGVLVFHQKLIGWLSQFGGKWPLPSSTLFKGNHADFWFDSGIANNVAMLVTARVKRCVALLMLVFKVRQHGGAVDTVKCKSLARGNCLD